MDSARHTGALDPALDLNGWHEPTRRVRRLQRIQAITLATVCATSIVLVAVIGGAILRSVSGQHRAERQVRELGTITSDGFALFSEVWQRRFEKRSILDRRFLESYTKIRDGIFRLSDEGAGGDDPAAATARAEAVRQIRAIEGLVSTALTTSPDAATLDRSLKNADPMIQGLSNGMNSWTAAAKAKVEVGAAESRTLVRKLLFLITGLLGALFIVGFVLWLGLERARARLMHTLRASEGRFRSLVQNSSDAVIVADTQGIIRYASQPIERLYGYAPADLLGRRLEELVHQDDFSPMSHLTKRGMSVLDTDEPIEWRIRHRDGGEQYVETVCSRQLDDPAINGYVLNTRDITERKEMEATLTHRAFHDALTDLANRALFLDRANHALTRTRRHDEAIAVVVLDLDDFKTVNDSLGHGAGDTLLVEVAERLRATLRSTDTAARLGGDEFAILIETANDVDEVCALADRVVEALRAPLTLDGRELVVRASLGIAMADDPSATAADLIRNADTAMYAAKGRGRGGYAVFEQSMVENATNRLALTTDLHRALERDQLRLAYQPIVSLDSHRVLAVEALMRWNHPDHGPIEPNVFIPIAEETGLIVPLGAWALETALRHAASWTWEGADEIQMSVNVAVRQLEQPDFVQTVRAALATTNFPAARLTLEITESDVMRDSELTLAQLTALKELGVMIAVDDFGTGYSSLSYLAKLPIDIVKIDRSFVSGLSAGQRDARIAGMIVGIGDSLGLHTVAEGVEDLEQVEGLRELGCVLAQGFYFSHPMSGDELGPALGRTRTLSF